MAKTKTSTTVKDRWNSQNYDDIRIRIPKGHKTTVQTAADLLTDTLTRLCCKGWAWRNGRRTKKNNSRDRKGAPLCLRFNMN